MSLAFADGCIPRISYASQEDDKEVDKSWFMVSLPRIYSLTLHSHVSSNWAQFFYLHILCPAKMMKDIRMDRGVANIYE